MATRVNSTPIMYATKYWGAPAFVKIIPEGDNFDVLINDQHFTKLAYDSKHVLADVEMQLSDNEMFWEISQHIESDIYQEKRAC